ncbi:DUF2490 domain-containing protein [Cellulophaga sp. HaHaR_3_176]|uniref:DUF2490 domain-containing protein n=1 Tax=Cellulophaga sp. HaHaR_3_176 TaxID=1942464 RepID=UPI001C2009F4|nr:DUF2490 domain-containing protein [Cellulophaga sp. HaHaR_3_176]QWX83263.1 DUF2490 domain-containing protein [Cellulophaga sp. HaHaR_3_176]
MITYFIKIFIFSCILLSTTQFFAQGNFTGFIEPDFSINYDISKNYSHNFSIANRIYFYKDNDYNVEVRQLDFKHFSNFKLKYNQSVAFGIQYRFRETFEKNKNNELRFTEQYNFTHKPSNVRYGHRLRAEQRIARNLTTHRFRYRFAADMPLMGTILDTGEPYFIASTESLLSVAKGYKPSYDQRFTSSIGFVLTENTKLQAGLEYRFENYNIETTQNLFILTSLSLSL